MARNWASRLLFSCLATALFTLCVAAEGDQQVLADDGRKPNIVFVLTDDQDQHMESLSYMPYVQKHLVDQGVTFTRHYCTVALCCPSRVSLWTGKAAHNTNVTDINPPYEFDFDNVQVAYRFPGGYPKFISQGFNDHYLPVWLQKGGYNTYYVGKLFNAQTIYNYDSPHAAGWTGSEFLLDPYTYRYLNATFQRNHEKPVSYEGEYSTDVLAQKAYDFLEDALQNLKEDGKPFFLTIAPTAPHSDVNIRQKVIHGNFSEKTNAQSPPIPAERHKHLFKDVVVPRTPNFNPDKGSGASWIRRLPQQDQDNLDFNDHFYRNRLRALQAVDEMVDVLMARLTDADVLDNTYVFFSTDNGYSIGQHRRQPGKQCAFEEDINVPFIVRGPGIPEGVESNWVTSHTDLAPTFLSLARMSKPDGIELDGQAIPLTQDHLQNADLLAGSQQAAQNSWSQEHVNVEMWGIIMSEGKYGSVLYPNHTYKALRVVGVDHNLLYTVWCSGEHELYDMLNDPYQLDNLLAKDIKPEMPLKAYFQQLLKPLSSRNSSTTSTVYDELDVAKMDPTALAHLVNRLDALLLVLKTCKGKQCTHPWLYLFPNGEVSNLKDALSTRFDNYFESRVQRVQFARCEKGYIAESEGPMWDEGQIYMMDDEMAYV